MEFPYVLKLAEPFCSCSAITGSLNTATDFYTVITDPFSAVNYPFNAITDPFNALLTL